MPKTSDLQYDKALMCLFTGHPGTRKTSAAASFPGPIYFFDFDGRMKPVKKMFPEREDIRYDTYQFNYDKMARKMKDLVDDPTQWTDEDEERSDIPVKTIVVDSLTNLADGLIGYAKKLRGTGSANMKRGVLNLADITDYNYETTGLGDVISFLKTMNEEHKCHVILTAHLLRFEEADPGKGVGVKRISYSLLTAGKKVAAKIPSVFDEHYHFEVEGGWGEGSKVRAYTDVFGEYSAKTALPLPWTIDFTNRPFYEVLSEHLREKGIEIE